MSHVWPLFLGFLPSFHLFTLSCIPAPGPGPSSAITLQLRSPSKGGQQLHTVWVSWWKVLWCWPAFIFSWYPFVWWGKKRGSFWCFCWILSGCGTKMVAKKLIVSSLDPSLICFYSNCGRLVFPLLQETTLHRAVLSQKHPQNTRKLSGMIWGWAYRWGGVPGARRGVPCLPWRHSTHKEIHQPAIRAGKPLGAVAGTRGHPGPNIWNWLWSLVSGGAPPPQTPPMASPPQNYLQPSEETEFLVCIKKFEASFSELLVTKHGLKP